MKVLIPALGLLFLLAIPRPAVACRHGSDVVLRTSSALAAGTGAADTTPPSAIPSAWIEDVVRDLPEETACGGGTSCIRVGTVVVGLTDPTDDQTAAADIAYRIEPPLYEFQSDYLQVAVDGRLRVDFKDNGKDGLAFDVTITPVDLAGNEGPATTLHVTDSVGGGCRAGSGPLPGTLPAWLIATVLAWRGMRRRKRIA